LEQDECGELPDGELLREAVLIEVAAARSLPSVPLDGLDAVMLIERCDGELSKGNGDTLCTERLHDEVVVDTLECPLVKRAIRACCDYSKFDTLG
jgi:hypothetical protein